MPIELGPSEGFSDSLRLTLIKNKCELGFLDFEPRVPHKPATLMYVNTRPNFGMGYGRQLLQRFIQEVGHGMVVTSGIIHKPTWEALLSNGAIRLAYEEGRHVITEQAMFSRLPLTIFLQKGGMHISSMVITLEKQIPRPFEVFVKDIFLFGGNYGDFFTAYMTGNV